MSLFLATDSLRVPLISNTGDVSNGTGSGSGSLRGSEFNSAICAIAGKSLTSPKVTKKTNSSITAKQQSPHQADGKAPVPSFSKEPDRAAVDTHQVVVNSAPASASAQSAAVCEAGVVNTFPDLLDEEDHDLLYTISIQKCLSQLSIEEIAAWEIEEIEKNKDDPHAIAIIKEECKKATLKLKA